MELTTCQVFCKKKRDETDDMWMSYQTWISLQISASVITFRVSNVIKFRVKRWSCLAWFRICKMLNIAEALCMRHLKLLCNLILKLSIKRKTESDPFWCCHFSSEHKTTSFININPISMNCIGKSKYCCHCNNSKKNTQFLSEDYADSRVWVSY